MVVRKGAFFTLPPIINSNRALVKYAESFQIVLLNWIGPGIINVQKLGYRQGWYYVMHDLRSITNGCHYINSCEQFNTNCENCPRVRFKAPPVSSSLDLIAISNWTFDHALKKNLATSVFRAHNFQPQYIETVKSSFGNKFLFIAEALNDTRKGFMFIEEYFKMNTAETIELTIVGNSGGLPDWMKASPNIKVKGFLNQNDLIKEYISNTFLLFPSKEENYSNVLIEAIAHAVIPLCFDIGGNSEIVTEDCGILTKQVSNIGFSGLIFRALELSVADRKKLSKNARKRFVEVTNQNLIYSSWNKLFGC